MIKENNKVAMFIDAENISYKYADKLVEEASNYGDIIVRRVFADWSSQQVQPWKDMVSKHSFSARQKFSEVKGKNSSDISLIIDAMVVLFERDVDIFCLASSDSDFTSLVQELRERGKTVVGFGMKQTVSGFVNAFSEFIYLDKEDDNEEPAKMTAEKKARIKSQPILSRTKFNALSEVLDRLIEKNGKAYYSLILSEMKNKYSDFIPKNYGCRSMKEFMAKIMANTKKYEIMTDTDGTSMYIVPKKKKNA